MDELCNVNVNPALSMTAQVSTILVLSHVFHIILKPLGQHAPIAQILAGFVLGPSCLSRWPQIHNFFFENFVIDFYASLALYSRIGIMFLIGLEMDVSYIINHSSTTSVIAFGGCLMCTIFATAISYFVYEETNSQGSIVMLALVLTVILASTASPIVFRLVADLKFTTTDFGRLAIYCSLISDMYAVFILIIITAVRHRDGFFRWLLKGLFSLLLLVGVVILTNYLANSLNRHSRNRKHLRPIDIMLICLIVVSAAMTLETMGFSSVIACFIMGLMFPRQGKSARTMLATMTYTVHNFIFPIYFGFVGFRTDIRYLNSIRNIGIVVMVILLSIGGKIVGTLLACRYLKRPLNEGVLLAFLFNMKGHVDLLTLTSAMLNKAVTSYLFYNLMIICVLISSMVSSMVVSFLVKREGQTFGIKHIPLEFLSPKKELKLLVCVHSPHMVPTMVSLIESLRGHEDAPITPYFMHLVELREQQTENSADYKHQEELSSDDDDDDDDDVYDVDDTGEINEAVDILTAETNITIHQVKTVSPQLRMCQEVCEFVDNVRASIIILPFHKHQRIDGKFEKDKESIRRINQKVMHDAPCSVAILIDRRHTAKASLVTGSECLQQTACLFFGGPDDREALGVSKRISRHHHSNLTIIRFLPTSKKVVNVGINVSAKGNDVPKAALNIDADIDKADSSALKKFYHSYVTSGKAGFVEKYVDNGAHTAMVLIDMANMYSVIIVGKGSGRLDSALTTGMSDWEECPELGTVGDFLASSEFNISGSVLVIQQRVHKQGDHDDI
ncbi:cation/H(+) antiporter 1-like [Rutidosis leptorrhynchoides]|uniref:cation/H(+) antiporter 1-like n=1 Tax=Rutidosis leptorrhynchoides TaxID=125765 RepID=UPI003A9A2C07